MPPLPQCTNYLPPQCPGFADPNNGGGGRGEYLTAVSGLADELKTRPNKSTSQTRDRFKDHYLVRRFDSSTQNVLNKNK